MLIPPKPGDDSGHPVSAATALRSSQIIVAVFMLGVVMFAAIAVAVRPSVAPALPNAGAPPAVPASDLFGIIAGALLLSATAAMPLLGGLMVRRGRAIVEAARRAKGADHEAALAQPFQLLTILRASVAELPALLATTTVFITGEVWPLAIAAGALVLMALGFPTRDRFERFVRRCSDEPAVFSIGR